jgi:hypothetical protein
MARATSVLIGSVEDSGETTAIRAEINLMALLLELASLADSSLSMFTPTRTEL